VPVVRGMDRAVVKRNRGRPGRKDAEIAETAYFIPSVVISFFSPTGGHIVRRLFCAADRVKAMFGPYQQSIAHQSRRCLGHIVEFIDVQ
jgi:hypothetical protein